MLNDAVAQAAAVRRGEVSAVELARAAIEVIDARNPVVNAVIHPRFEQALDEARHPAVGPLSGVPILLKDSGATMQGEPFHEGLAVARDAGHRAPHTSWLVTRLQAAGCVILGRTNVPELCTHTTTEPLSYGPSRNPWNTDHSSGGSSGGSGSAVAAGMVAIAHGSDGGGSVRAPAGWCGLVGLKPTRGRFSNAPEHGEHWVGFSTDGFLTFTVRDTAAVLDAVMGPHPSDPYQTREAFDLMAAMVTPLPRLRIGVRTRGACGGNPSHPEVDAALRQVASLLSDAGHEVVEASPSALDDEAAIVHQGVVVSTAVAADLDTWSARLGRPIELDEIEPRNRLSVSGGRTIGGVQFLASREWLWDWSRRLVSWWDDFDLLLTPTITQPPVRIGELPVAPSSDDMAAMRRHLGWLLGAWNVTGQPAISVPAGLTSAGLPIGAHFVAPWAREDLLVQVARFIEQAHPWERAPM